MGKEKITDHQLFSLAANGAIGGSVIIIPSILAGIAKQDAWIATLITAVCGLPVIWIYCFLGSRYPGMTFVGIIKKIFGKWIGFIAAAGYVFLLLTSSYNVPWYFGNFITTQAMPETPEYIINLLLITTVVIAVLYGVETIARTSELFMYFSSALFLVAMIFALPNARIENLQPVFENGVIPIFKSSVFLSGFMISPLISLMMIYPVNINNVPQAKKSFFKGYLWGAFILFVATLMSILVLGSVITAVYQYPTYTLAKEINVGIIFTRLEFVIAASWFFTEFVIAVLFFYAGVTGFSELLGLKEHKKIVVPLGLIMSIMSTVVFPDAIYQANWVKLVWIPYIATYGFILPVLLLLVFLIKKWVLKQT